MNFVYTFISSGIDIICVSETWFHHNISDTIYELPEYNIFRVDKESDAGGVCIYARNELKCRIKLKSDQNNEIEYIFLKTLIKHKIKTLIGAVYRPNRNVPFNNLKETIGKQTIYFNYIIIAEECNSTIVDEKTSRNQ